MLPYYGTGLHLGDCKIAVIVSLFIRLIYFWNTPKMLEIAYPSFKKSKIFWRVGACPQTPLDGSHLQCSTRLSQNPSYGPDLLSYVIRFDDWNLSRSPAKYPPRFEARLIIPELLKIYALHAYQLMSYNFKIINNNLSDPIFINWYYLNDNIKCC
jgi:hypothetical protein